MKYIRREEMPTPNVTDHAVLRYLERVKNVDVDGARREIAQAMRSAMAHNVSCVRWRGARFIVRDGSVITVLEGTWLAPFDRPVDPEPVTS